MATNQLHYLDMINFNISARDGEGAEDLSDATLIRLTLTKPDGSTANYYPTFTTDGTDGGLEVIITFNSYGLYRAQLFIQYPSNQVYSDVKAFRVYPNVNTV